MSIGPSLPPDQPRPPLETPPSGTLRDAIVAPGLGARVFNTPINYYPRGPMPRQLEDGSWVVPEEGPQTGIGMQADPYHRVIGSQLAMLFPSVIEGLLRRLTQGDPLRF